MSRTRCHATDDSKGSPATQAHATQSARATFRPLANKRHRRCVSPEFRAILLTHFDATYRNPFAPYSARSPFAPRA
eukprot:6200956-Pleurochrysis_carterae.AAC.1